MTFHHDKIQRFVFLADNYFRLTGKSAGDLSDEEMEDLYALVTQCPAPDKFHKLIERKIQGGVMGRAVTFPAEGWRMLPPEQRIL